MRTSAKTRWLIRSTVGFFTFLLLLHLPTRVVPLPLEYNLNAEIIFDLEVLKDITTVDQGPFIDHFSKGLVTDRDGLLHVVYGGNHLYHLYQEGGLWVSEVVDEEAGVGEYATLVLDADGTLHVTYINVPRRKIKYARKVWDEPWEVQDVYVSPTRAVRDARLVVDSGGRPHIAFSTHGSGNYLMTCEQNAAPAWTCTSMRSLHALMGYAIDSDDTLYVAYREDGFYLARKGTADARWRHEQLRDEDGHVFTSTRGLVHVDDDGNLHLLYQGSDGSNTGILRYLMRPSGAVGNRWSQAQNLWSYTGSGFQIHPTALAVDSEGNKHIVFYFEVNDSGPGRRQLLYFNHSSFDDFWEDGDGAAAEVVYETEHLNQPLLYSALHVDAENNLHLAFYDALTQQLYRTVRTPSSGWSEPESLVRTADVGRFPSLVLDERNKAHVTYQDAGNRDLKYATNASGPWVVETLVAEGDVGGGSSIAMDREGQFHIAYYDATRGALRYIRSLAEGGWSLPETVDDVEDTGLFPDLILDPRDDAPHISYWNRTYRSIRVAVRSAETGSWSIEAVSEAVINGSRIEDWDGGVRSTIHFDGDHQLYVAFRSYQEGNFYSRRTEEGWVSRVIPGNSQTGGHSLFLDHSGRVHGAYQNGQDLAWVSNSEGFWEQALFPNDGIEGKYSALVTDENNHDFIAYHDETATGLYFITRGIDSGWRGALLDDNGHPGKFVSLVRDGTGFFHGVSYNEGLRSLDYIRFEIDADEDGFLSGSDCNDGEPDIYPGGSEVCGDGDDNDCDGVTDEEAAAPHITWYRDADGDGFAGPGETRRACGQAAGYYRSADDCNDSDDRVSPGTGEICWDGIDNDCDASVDDSCVRQGELSRDDDGDGYSEVQGDCHDGDASRNPGADEACDGLDNDCDGRIDEESPDRLLWFLDNDSDGFGDASHTRLLCEQPWGYVDNDLDCDDTRKRSNPLAPEVCGDSLDNNCGGGADEEEALPHVTWYEDLDADEFGNPESTRMACGRPAGYVSEPTDCDDRDDAAHPGSSEICLDGSDNDCDGFTDENCDGDDATTGGDDVQSTNQGGCSGNKGCFGFWPGAQESAPNDDPAFDDDPIFDDRRAPRSIGGCSLIINK